MSIPVFRVINGITFAVKPVGNMLRGWLPGTIVNFVEGTDNKYVSVDWASKYPNKVGAAGFTINGSLRLNNNFDRRFANDNELSGMWTEDELIQFTKSDENLALEFDSNKQLSYLGKDITTINFDAGIFKIYTFEKYDEDYLASNGTSGDVIDWKSHIGELLGVSSRSLFTTLDNNVITEAYEYRVGGLFVDENNKEYILAIRR